MNKLTPTPVQFCNHKGMKSHYLVAEHNIKLYKASTLKSKLPYGLCVSGNDHCITYRFCWEHPKQRTWHNHYFEIVTYPDGYSHYTGSTLNYNMHRSFMQTYEIVLPIAERIFTTGPFAKLAA